MTHDEQLKEALIRKAANTAVALSKAKREVVRLEVELIKARADFEAIREGNESGP